MTAESNNTSQSFSDKWKKNSSMFFEDTLNQDSNTFNWIIKRNGYKNADEFSAYLESRELILDAGCGNGRIIALMDSLLPTDHDKIFHGVDLVAHEVASENFSHRSNMHFSYADLTDESSLKELPKFDFIYCQEVLHHTANPKKSFLNLTNLLTEGGEIAIYVYKKKAAIREFADDNIRDKIGDLDYDQALELMKPITELGKILSDLKIKIDVPNIELLDVPAGEYDLQRFIYHFFLKCYWNDQLSQSECDVINYDWYHPQLCSRHTLDEVKSWMIDANLEINHAYEDHYGITMRARSIKR
jgi:SAM-dependent methyltransferase